MKKITRWIGMDVHAETIAIAVAEADGMVRSIGNFPNEVGTIRRQMGKLAKGHVIRCCYEAGPCGYVLYWQLASMGYECEVIAPTLIPKKSGDRVKTDRRDAEKLARCFRSGDLTEVWVPDEKTEALRELVRLRSAAKKDEHRHRQRVLKFLLRHGLRKPDSSKSWGAKHMQWLDGLKFEIDAHQVVFSDMLNEVKRSRERVERLEQSIESAIATMPENLRAIVEGLQALRGVATIAAVTLATEIGNFSRFERPSQLMAYAGLVPGEYSSGASTRRGHITKTGNSHMRHVLGEAAWHYRGKPSVGYAHRKRQESLDEETKAIGWKAQNRLNQRYRKMSGRGKSHGHTITAISRELLGFVWAIGTHIEKKFAA